MSNSGVKTTESQLSFDFDGLKKMKPNSRLETLKSMQDQVERMTAFLSSDLDFLQKLHKNLAGSTPLTEHVGVDWSMAHIGGSVLDLETRLNNMDILLQRAIDSLSKGQDANDT